MHNRVEVEGGLLVVTVAGDQNGQSVSRLFLDLATARLGRNPDHMLVLMDLRQLGRTTSEARQTTARRLNSLPYEKLAFFGANPKTAFVIKLGLKASKDQRSEYFENEESAKDWLLGGNQ